MKNEKKVSSLVQFTTSTKKQGGARLEIRLIWFKRITNLCPWIHYKAHDRSVWLQLFQSLHIVNWNYFSQGTTRKHDKSGVAPAG